MPRQTLKQALARYDRLSTTTAEERERYEEQKQEAANARQYERDDSGEE